MESNRDKASSLIAKHRLMASAISQSNEVPQHKLFDNRVALSVSETAFVLGVSVRTVERMVQRNELRVRRLGRRVLIPKDELGAWLNNRKE